MRERISILGIAAGSGPHRARHVARAIAGARLVSSLVLLAAVLSGCAVQAEPGSLHVLTATGVVGRPMERYIDRALSQAEDNDAAAVLLRIDTPGGEIGAMKGIVGRIERAGVPVITWVGPTGAEAASAGTFIAMAGHVAAMAPNTTIGAAAPVGGGGEDLTGTIGKKVENDTVAFARGVAELRGRDADWAERAVRDAVSATPDEAVELGVVDLVAPTMAELLAAVDGRSVSLLSGASVTLKVVDAPQVQNGPNLYERLLRIISDPLIVSLLLLAGVIGIGAELFAPGLLVPFTAGVIALLLAFLGIGTLLPGEAAVALVLVGLALFAMEFFVPSGGVLGAGAAIALVLGLSILLGQVSTALTLAGVLTIVAIVAGALALIVGAGFVVIARGYMSQSSESGGRLL